MRKRPLLLAAIVFLLGICYGQWKSPLLPCVALGVALASYVSQRRKAASRSGNQEMGKDKAPPSGVARGIMDRWLLPGVLVLVFVAGVLRMEDITGWRQQTEASLADGSFVTVQGTIVKKENKKDQTILELAQVSVREDHSTESLACGKIRVGLSSDIYPIGTILIIEGQLHMFSEARNEGAFDQRSFYQSQGIWFELQNGKVRESHEAGGMADKVSERLYQIRVHLLGVIEQLMEAENAGVLAGMLIGEKNRMDAQTRLVYKNAGIAHLLAISALHISIFAMSIYRFLRRHGRGYLAAAVGAGICILLYADMTGASVSTRRAVAMFLMMTAAGVLARSYDMLNALGAWMCIALWENPALIGYQGFVFSVTAVAGIGVTVRILSERDPDEEAGETHHEKRGSLRRSLAESFAGGFGIQITTLPLVAYYYFEIPTYAIFLNLLVIPLMPAVLVAGAVGAGIGSFSLALGRLAVWPAGAILACYRWIGAISLHLPFAQVIVGRPSPVAVAGYYAGLIAILALWKKPECRKYAAVGFAGLLLLLYHPKSHSEELDVLDVGQGLGVYLAAADGTTFFIDGGSTSENSVGTYEILPFLKSRGIREIDYWCISHADEDHINGAIEVFEAGFSVHHLVLAEAMPRDEAYEKLTEAALGDGAEIVTMRAGQRLVMGGEELICLFPEERAEKVSGSITTVDRNKLCLTLLFKGRGASALFPGDLSAEEEARLLRRPELGAVDIYVASHHGSRYGSSQALLQTIAPKIAVVSCSLHNHYGHPGAEAVSRMQEAGAQILYTMHDGQIRVY